MRILLVGAGGVGGAVTAIAARRAFVDRLVVADFDPARAGKAVAAAGDPRFVAARLDAADEAAVRAHRSACTTWSTTPGPWRSTGARRWSGRPRSTRSSRSSCWRPGSGRASGVLGPEALDAVPFLDLLTAYGSPWGMREGG